MALRKRRTSTTSSRTTRHPASPEAAWTRRTTARARSGRRTTAGRFGCRKKTGRLVASPARDALQAKARRLIRGAAALFLAHTRLFAVRQSAADIHEAAAIGAIRLATAMRMGR